jgi:hypothetical protein
MFGLFAGRLGGPLRVLGGGQLRFEVADLP